jgi:hypothetical protein
MQTSAVESSVIDTLTSQSNKAMLVDVLAKVGVINNETPREIIIASVDNATNVVRQQSLPSDNLVTLNKRALQLIKEAILKGLKVEDEGYSPTTQTTERQPYTAQDLAKHRKQTFDNELEQRQQEFNTFMKRETPQGLSFSDEMDKPIGSEMDSLIQKAVAARNLDMEPNQVKLQEVHKQPSNSIDSNIEKRLQSIEGLLEKIWNKINDD